MNRIFDPPFRYFSIYLAVFAFAETVCLTRWSPLFCGMLALGLFLAARYSDQPDWERLAALCVFLAIGMNVSYQAMAKAVPALRIARFDDQLLAIDRHLLGETPSLLLEPFIHPLLTDFFAICYIFFLPLLFFSLVRYFFRQRELLGEFYAGLFAVYGLGFLGYLLIPAAGPWYAHADLFKVELTGSPLTMLIQKAVHQGNILVDVWPSLHCAASAYILGFAWRYHRREFYCLLLPVLGLWGATMYLRYHYFTDVMFGLALALFGLREALAYSTVPQKELENVAVT
jgi:hypothetical protein